MQDEGLRAWRRLSDLMDQALDLPPDQRADFATAACTGDAALLKKMRDWLAALDADSEFMEHAHTLGSTTENVFVPLPEGSRIGAYRVEHLLGRGGMGEVYAAARDDGQFEQLVAIKLINAEFAHEPALFLAERRILAGLEHPGITRLFDGGLSGDGRPYMVMERVDGQDLLSWCRSHRLGLEARLQLFIQLCEAMGYAHRRLVVHRDIKPSNVLVTAAGTPKLLDFGIAHLIGAAKPAADAGSLRLTPAYAAPEQLAGGEITTATDVYALGGLLYRLLTDRPPLELSGLPAALAIDRAVNETPPPPSTAVKAGGKGLIAPRRLRGDLDAIVLKALAKDPQERYANAGGLEQDLRRYLRREPVDAVRATPGYLLSRFVDRHRLLSAAASLVLLTVLSALVLILHYAGQLRVQRDIARNEANAAQQVTDYLISLFNAVSPARTGGKPIEPRTLVDQGKAQLEEQLKDQPLLRARLLGTVGALYCELGLSEECRRNVERALQMQRADPGADAQITAQLHYWLGQAYSAETDYSDAERSLRESLAQMETQQPPRNNAIAATLTTLGYVLRSQQKIPDSIAALERARLLLRNARGADSLDSAETLGSLALSYQEAGRTDAAILLAQQRIELVRQGLGPSDLRYFDALDDYAEVMASAGHGAQAEQARREVVAGYSRIYGAVSQRTLDAKSNLGNFLMYEGHLVEATAWMNQALDGYRELESVESRDYAATLRHRGGVHFYRGDYAGAADDFAEAYRLLLKLYGPSNLDTHIARLNLGRAESELDHTQKALQLLQPEVPAQLTGDYADYIRFMRLKWMGDCYARDERDPLATQTYDQAERAFKASGERDLSELSKLTDSRAQLLLRQGRYREALPLLRQVVADYQGAYSADSAFTQIARLELAEALASLDQREEARVLARQARTTLERELLPTHRARIALKKLAGDE